MITKKIKPQELTNKNFSLFGKVIYAEGNYNHIINQGNSKVWSNLLEFDGKINMMILRTKCINQISYLERHILTHYQIFIPLNNKESLVVVAKNDKENIKSNDLEFFLMQGNQGIVLNSKVWHHTLFSLKGEQEYLLINCGGKFPPDTEINELDDSINLIIK